ncbi:4'-phosphopantetheinyl transferase superfamily protein [Rhodoferax sp.]|uniref:4'-phosphopantetheinyl transferase family protein n=1 Tax=Rhodoferax sp. TaxID=50421 RepID=UPI0025EE5328|nr:4'-phosphopantetheinyl transferase superfamily protein [Rhodoferax sp.]
MLPATQVLAVRSGPHSLPVALQDIRSVQALTVVGVATPVTTQRTVARGLVRDALRQTLGAFLDQPAASIALVSPPSQAIAVDAPRERLGLSVSHAPGLSLAAIAQGARVGVDVVRIENAAEAYPDWLCVARDYLGPQATAWLQATPATDCPVAFMQAWTQFEACLKCLGLGLTEWSPQLGAQLATCQVWALDFGANHSGPVATDGHFIGSVAVQAPALRSVHPAQR